jgi:RNA polymerase sigma-70 factor (ECF subfamily)
LRKQPGSAPAKDAKPGVLDEETKARQFRELALPHLDDAYNFARWLTRSAVDAEDVVQDAYMRAFQYFGGFNGVNARPWILAIVRNSYLAWLRKARPQAAVPLDDFLESKGELRLDALDWSNAEQSDPESALIRKLDAAAVQTLIAALPNPFREALVLRELEDLSYQQIADVTGVPIGTVMSRLARARGLLQKAWLHYQEKERGR